MGEGQERMELWSGTSEFVAKQVPTLDVCGEVGKPVHVWHHAVVERKGLLAVNGGGGERFQKFLW